MEKASAVVAVDHLGYSSLKELQWKVITSFVAGDDVFDGKSLCYACLPLLFDHLHQLEEPQ